MISRCGAPACISENRPVDVGGEASEDPASKAQGGGPGAPLGPELVHDYQAGPGLRDARGLGEDPGAIGGDGDDERQVDSVEALVREIKVLSVHLAKLEVRHPELRLAGAGAAEHPVAEVHAETSWTARQVREVETAPDPDEEQRPVRREVQGADGPLAGAAGDGRSRRRRAVPPDRRRAGSTACP